MKPLARIFSRASMIKMIVHAASRYLTIIAVYEF
jgi:hypothetical protein